MSTIHAELPDKLFQQVNELARRENIPVERLVALALAQALGAWETQSVIAERARHSSREDFLRFMATSLLADAHLMSLARLAAVDARDLRPPRFQLQCH